MKSLTIVILLLAVIVLTLFVCLPVQKQKVWVIYSDTLIGGRSHPNRIQTGSDIIIGENYWLFDSDSLRVKGMKKMWEKVGEVEK